MDALFGWLGGLTLAGTGAFIMWTFSLRKLREEIKKLKSENAALQSKEDLATATLTLWKRANILRAQTTHPCLSRAGWASCLKKPEFIDKALAEVGAQPVPGEGDLWIIDPMANEIPARWK